MMNTSFRLDGVELDLDQLEYNFLYLVFSHLLYGIRVPDDDFRDLLRLPREGVEAFQEDLWDEEKEARARGEHWNPHPYVFRIPPGWPEGVPFPQHEPVTRPARESALATFRVDGVVLHLNPAEFDFVVRTISYVLHGILMSDNDFRNLLGMLREDAAALLEVLREAEREARARGEFGEFGTS